MNNIKDQISSALSKALENAPVSDQCPLIKNPRWNCRPLDKGEEPQCKSVSGYTNCSHYIKWFYFLVAKSVAKEMNDGKTKRKKEAKKER